jgi:hypothetical protein
MLADPSYAHKLWNRGVDIGVGVVTSVIVGLVGLAFWRAKLWLDLRSAAEHQRQEYRIAEELQLAKQKRQARERQIHLRAEVEVFAQQAEGAPHSLALCETWDQYLKWILRERLIVPGNEEILTKRAAWGPIIASSLNLVELRKEAAGVIRSTKFPPEPF